MRKSTTVLALLVLAAAKVATAAEDASIRRDGTTWIMATSAVQRVVALEDGKFLLKSLKNKVTGRELAAHGGGCEFSASLGDKCEVSSAIGPWTLLNENSARLPQGEQQLDLGFRQGPLVVTKHYVVYPGSSLIREWVTFANIGSKPLKLIEPSFLQCAVRLGARSDLDFHWMTGGDNRPGSWLLKTEKLGVGKPRQFDCYEPFPGMPARGARGDGVNVRILQGTKQLWPDKGWRHVADSSSVAPFDVGTEVAAGDRLLFVVNMNHGIGYDTTALDPTIRYSDGETHVASKEFSGQQGRSGWQYQYLEKDRPVDLVYYPQRQQWRKAKDNATGTPFVGAGHQHPDVGEDSVRVWTAPKAGRVRITGSACNSGNRSDVSLYGFRSSTSSYAPWYALRAGDTKAGLFIGWDYFGHWTSSFSVGADGDVAAALRVAGHKQTLKPGESVTTPKAFVGLFHDDLDEAGNELLDWQYRYMWDYTREHWFPAIRMLGYWMKGTGWGKPGVSWTGGNPDLESTVRKVFRVADLMRYVGADVYHRDWGWWDCAGDWNGPDFRTTNDYLRKHGMGQLIYAFLYTVDPKARVVREHPDWLIGGTLDMSQPKVVEFISGLLDRFVQRWGDFEWRIDGGPFSPCRGDDTPLLAQDVGLRTIIRQFLDRHPGCAFQGCNGGGNLSAYDYARYASCLSISDGAVGILRNYYAALLFPPDKTSDIPDIYNPNNYDKATWRGLLCINFDMTGDTWDSAKLEGLRELVDIYHYLQAQGVVGRWVRVYRPVITGDDPTLYFQRLSRDRLRGIIIPKRPAPGAVTIKPKGLVPGATYLVSFHESTATESRSGADLIERGISIAKMRPGELIYLNLPLHPGSKRDTTAPTPPQQATKARGENMGYPGIELTWKPGTDDNWVSYYRVLRNGIEIDKVAKGTYCFDHSGGADLAAKYELETVDGGGNASARVLATGSAARPARIVDDAPGAGITFAGRWQHQAKLQPAHAGSIAQCREKGAAAQWTFEGSQILWFSKLGADCGKAAVSVDGAPETIVDTYSADDIWGVCVYRQKLNSAGRHTLQIRVLGEAGPRSGGATVYVDAFRAED